MFGKIFLSVVYLGMVGPPVQTQPVGPALYDNLSELPRIYSNVESYYLSSYDRTGGNDDGFRGTYSQLYVDQAGERVIFDEDGPGCVYNLWFTGTGQDLHWGKLRFYFDGEERPRIECEAREFFSGRYRPFVYPLVTNSFISSGGFSCSAPVPFAKHLKITTEKTCGFYNVYYQIYRNVNPPLPGWTGQKSAVKTFLQKNFGNLRFGGKNEDTIFKIFYSVVDISVRGGNLIVATWILR
jgi:hypothetical protein